MKAAIYARVSTEEQETANQLPVLFNMIQQRGYELVITYQEQDTAWKDGHQPELARMLDDARRGRFQILLIWALDRLTRAGALAILNLIDRLKKYGVKVISCQESWTEAPGELADILYAMTGWVAQMESKRRSERTKAGIARKKAEGNGHRGPDKVHRVRRWYKRPTKTSEQ